MQIRKVVLAGGTGYLGTLLQRHFEPICDEVIVLTRGNAGKRGRIQFVQWDGKTLGDWTQILEKADVLVNLAGRSVNCRYTEKNRREIVGSRIDSVAVLTKAVQTLVAPPKVWLQSASATIYRHAEDRPQTEKDGDLGHGFSENVCRAWEAGFVDANLPGVRKIILRTSLVLGVHGGVLPRLNTMVRFGLGGHQGNGRQKVAWISEVDFVGVVDWCIQNEQARGIYNVTAPEVPTNRELMLTLRRHIVMPVGLPAPAWLLSFGAVLIGTEPELILKSRWVLPERLLAEGFGFAKPTLKRALGREIPE